MRHTEVDEAAARTGSAAQRALIVQAAAETIADYGLLGASFARIAERAEASGTLAVHHHFKNKQQLIEELVSDVIARLGQLVAARVRQRTTARGRLLALLRAHVEFTDTHRVQMSALMAIFTNGGFPFAAAGRARALAPIEAILRDGQTRGEFRAFDPQVMASLAQCTLDSLPILLETQPELDLAVYAHEVTTLFDVATRRVP
ncbi:TetR family transcriptional regulator [Streptomyces sp. NPDC020379]|uniref:TetR family transcriptional regulator n=1 Tax=Streptomyces sp. NPDC020379 TaxID=3365071 RepID=UPI0037997628